MDGAQSAAAQEVRSARACLDKVFDVPKATRRADYRRKALLVTFRACRKVTRSAMEWHRKNRRERFFTSALARSPKGESRDGTNKPAMDGTQRGHARATSHRDTQERASQQRTEKPATY